MSAETVVEVVELDVVVVMVTPLVDVVALEVVSVSELVPILVRFI